VFRKRRKGAVVEKSWLMKVRIKSLLLVEFLNELCVMSLKEEAGQNAEFDLLLTRSLLVKLMTYFPHTHRNSLVIWKHVITANQRPLQSNIVIDDAKLAGFPFSLTSQCDHFERRPAHQKPRGRERDQADNISWPRSVLHLLFSR
jgi:hypothetical protein